MPSTLFMYVMITLQTVALALSLAGSDRRVLRYRDNLVLKLSFWPILLST